ncbi:MAG TPA: GDSL-type esterase/lipase family protein [Opitutus sp.]|nr:GDSL-type esterase/lipase family protein [Opitutus sp.]
MKRTFTYWFLLVGAFALSPFSFNSSAVAAPVAAAERSNLEIPATDDGLPGAGPIRRYDWFQKLWVERRTGWAARVRQDQNALVFLGDSITQGWGDVGSSFPGIKTANRGISGDTTRGVLIRLQEDVVAINPKGVVLLIGTNDIEEQAELEVIASNLKLIVAALKQHNPTMPVVLCRVMPSSPEKKRPAEKIRKLNQLYAEAMRDEPQVTMLDTWALFANVQGDSDLAEFPDLLHPNTKGYGKWAKALRPVLETLALAPAWPDDFAPEPGFQSLFNGRDLTGWSYPEGTSLDGKIASEDGRFRAVNGRVVVTVSRLQSDYKKLWTTRKFPKDFVLKLEFRASPNADSGIFIREPQLQCRDYLIAGPYTTLKNYRPMEWNEIVVTVKGGLAHATCNGEIIADAIAVPATGSIGFESDRGQMEYRRIQVKEL